MVRMLHARPYLKDKESKAIVSMLLSNKYSIVRAATSLKYANDSEEEMRKICTLL